MRLNTSQVQQLLVLSDIMQIMRNPKALKEMIEDLEKATNESRDIIEKERQIKDLDKWRDNTVADINVRARKQKDYEARVAENKCATDLRCAAESKKIDDAWEVVREQQADVEADKKTLANVAAATTKLNKDRVKLDKDKALHVANKKAYKVKLDKVEALLGGKV